MPDLNFHIEGAEPQRFAAAPTLRFSLRVDETSGASIHAVALRCQVRIEPGRRRYSAAEEERLLDLFGTPERWGQTVRPMLWTHLSVVLPPFEASGTFDLSVPCTFDFSHAASRYFSALDEGDLPLCFLFSGTVFHAGPTGALQVAQIPWDREASYRLPALTWRGLMDEYYPNSTWLSLRRDVFEAVDRYRAQAGLPSWERALERLLDAAGEPVSP